MSNTKNTIQSDQLLGRLVVSRAGHDKGTLLCVLATDGEYLMLADGRRRKVQAPKRKKKKHVTLINTAAYSGTQSNKALRSFIRAAMQTAEYTQPAQTENAY